MAKDRTNKTALAICVIAMLAATPLYANDIPVTNHSFESPDLPDGVSTGPIPGWVITGGAAGVWDPIVGQSTVLPDCPVNPSAAFVTGIPDGAQVAYSNAGDISQAVGATIQPGNRYTLSVSMGVRCGYAGYYANHQYALILADGVTPISHLDQVTTNVSWTRQQVSYTSQPGDPLTGVQLTIAVENKEGVQLDFDNVRLQVHKVLKCQGFMPPFDKPLSLKKKQSTAIPMKMTLTDLFGTAITDANVGAPPKVQVSVGSESGSAIAGYDETLLPAGLSDDGNEFRYDQTSQQWIINLATKQYTGTGAYTVKAVAGDDSYVIDPGCSQTFARQ